MAGPLELVGSPYLLEQGSQPDVDAVDLRVSEMRSHGRLGPRALETLRRHFRIKNIYNSNAIEGNTLDLGETRLVVERGLTLTGKPLKDQAEAGNLAGALELLEDLARDVDHPITERDIRDLHRVVLQGINDDEAGRYRSAGVEISGSAYKPPEPESVGPQMEELSEWLRTASLPGNDTGLSPILLASAAHTWLVTIHPFIDGNGRVGRLLLNLMLMRYGYPIAVITREDRLRYYDALERSQSCDLTGVVALVAECVEESLEEYERAVAEQVQNEEWTRAVARRFTEPERVRAGNEYELWKSAMDLLKGYFRQTAEALDAQAVLGGRVWFKDFGTLEFEKYASLRARQSAKRTWFFRIDLRSGDTAVRYLFFFESPSPALRDRCDVTACVSREDSPYHYERLDNISAPNVPDLREIGYLPGEERFVARYGQGGLRTDRIEAIGRQFIEQIVQGHFSH